MIFTPRCDVVFPVVFLANLISAVHVGSEREHALLALLKDVASQQFNINPHNDVNALARMVLALQPASIAPASAAAVGRRMRSRREPTLMGWFGLPSNLDELADWRDANFDMTGLVDESAGAQKIDFTPQIPLPGSYEETLGIAYNACVGAYKAGFTRYEIDVCFDTDQDEAKRDLDGAEFLENFIGSFVDSFAPVGEDPDATRLQLLYENEGQAAYARQNPNWPKGTVVGALSQRTQLEAGVEVGVFVSPRDRSIGDIQMVLRLIETEAPTALVFLINPNLIRDSISGSNERMAAQTLRQNFAPTFALKKFIGDSKKEGIIYKVFPEGWTAWLDDDDESEDYSLVYAGQREPPSDVFGSGVESTIREWITDFQNM